MTLAAGIDVIVVDASVAIEVLRGDEHWLARWAGWVETETMILAPAHFPVEVANALLRGLRLAPSVAARRIELLYRAGIETTDRGPDGLSSSIGLAARHALTVYDAVYLDLAIDLEAELATLDAALRDAAAAEGVPLAG